VIVVQRRIFLKALRDTMMCVPVASVTGAPAFGQTSRNRTVTNRQHLKLFLAGDVMTGRGIDQVLPHPGNPALHESYVSDARDYVRLAETKSGPIETPVAYPYIWGDALDIWAAHEPDLRIVNLETSITTSDDYWPSKGIHYRMHPYNVGCLTAAKLDCCVLANNHVLDWGYAGLGETLTTLRVAGIDTAGAGRDIEEAQAPARLSVPGKGDVLVFAVADASSGVPESWSAGQDRGGVHLLDDLSLGTAGRLADYIAAERLPGDVVVASIHWGGNWGYRVPVEQRLFAHRLIDSGTVDIVHGHSSHHPKALEFYKGKAILYGSGDFVNDYEGIGGRERFRPWYAPMYFLTFDLHSRQVERVEIELLRVRRLQLIRSTAEDRQWLGARLNEFGKEFAATFEISNGSLVARTSIAGQ